MKKIFTLLFALGMFAAAQAQWDNRQPGERDRNDGYEKQRDVVTDNSFDKAYRYDKRMSAERNRDMQISQINREYDFKIQKVRKNLFMSRFEKQRLVRSLNDQREREIRMVMTKFKNKKNRRNDRDYPTNHHY